MPVKASISFKLHDALADHQGGCLVLTCDLNNSTYTIMSLYAPNVGQLKKVPLQAL